MTETHVEDDRDASSDGTATSRTLSPASQSVLSQTPNLTILSLSFCNIDGQSLQHLKYFEHRVCKDLVAHDHPGSNPFLQLLPLALEHPFILHILVANSALHLSNMTQRPKTSMSHSMQPRPARDESPEDPALIQALHAKGRAIEHLHAAIGSGVRVRREILLAAVLFFINFELIDLEVSSEWQLHIEGVDKLMMLLSQVDRSSTVSEPQRMLFDIVISDCFIYHILGSTLSHKWLKVTHSYASLFPVLKRTEAYCYLCCPTAILQIILSTSRLSMSSCSERGTHESIRGRVVERSLSLLHSALKFDIKGWIMELRAASSNAADHDSREHVAFAHRAAACLYILQAVPVTRARSPVSGDDLVSDIVAHLSHVNGDNPHFKATAWPSFVAGAETRDNNSRQWLLNRLLAAWEVCPWGYIFTAVDRLKQMWEMQDANEATPDDSLTDRVEVVRRLWPRNVDLLVV